jgi:hypothetical protein
MHPTAQQEGSGKQERRGTRFDGLFVLTKMLKV